MINIAQHRAEMARIHAEATKHVETYAAAEATAEEQAKQDERFATLDRMQKQLDEAQKLAQYAFTGEQPVAVKAVMPAKNADQVAAEAYEAKANAPAKFDAHEYGKALTGWALTGTIDDAYTTITTTTASSALLPKQVVQPITPTAGNAVREAMAAVGVTPMTTDSTAEINIPVLTVGTGSDLSETASSGTENTLGASGVSAINLKPAAIQSGQAWVSNLELNALEYDLLAELGPGLVEAKEQRFEQKMIAAIIADSGITQEVEAGGNTAEELAYEDFVDLNRKLSKKYDRLKVILLSDEAYAAAEKMKGTDGHPIFNRDPQNQQLLRFNGTPVIRCSFLEAFGNDKVIGLLISFVGFRVRDCGNNKLVRHVDDKDKVDQTGLNLVGYHCHGYVPTAVVKFVTTAS